MHYDKTLVLWAIYSKTRLALQKYTKITMSSPGKALCIKIAQHGEDIDGKYWLCMMNINE